MGSFCSKSICPSTRLPRVTHLKPPQSSYNSSMRDPGIFGLVKMIVESSLVSLYMGHSSISNFFSHKLSPDVSFFCTDRCCFALDFLNHWLVADAHVRQHRNFNLNLLSHVPDSQKYFILAGSCSKSRHWDQKRGCLLLF